jgi:hypothetical protein
VEWSISPTSAAVGHEKSPARKRVWAGLPLGVGFSSTRPGQPPPSTRALIPILGGGITSVNAAYDSFPAVHTENPNKMRRTGLFHRYGTET